MNRFDAHIHTRAGEISPGKLLAELNSVGLDGGGVFTQAPESPIQPGASYDDRLKCLQAWMQGTADRIFPIMWIHPYENDAIEKARDAAAKGAMGFKIICDCFYVYEPQPMALLHEIAKLGKPVMFHSGILWGRYETSKYNRPVNWEALITIPHLKFSLAHCSWPWTDECIALYGKFQNAAETHPDACAEMFLDVTPGTPAIYRRDLITKLLLCGYDVRHNLIFGTDCNANCYNAAYAKQWITRDQSIMQELGTSQRLIDFYMGENFLRFMGVPEKEYQHISTISDHADDWLLEYASQNM